MFKSYYNTELDKARPISELEDAFGQSGTRDVHAACTEELTFTAGEWKSWNEKKKAEVLMNYRIAYQGETSVNWCPGLGTVLANDEVKEGLSVLSTVFEEIHAVRTLLEKTDFEFAGPSGCDSVNESLHGLDLFLFGEDCLCRIVILAAGKREDADYQCNDEDIDAWDVTFHLL